MVSNPYRVLDKRCVFVRAWMAYCRAKVLQIVMRNLVGISTKRSQFQASNQRLKGEWINFDGIENVLSSERGRKIVVNMGEQRIPSEWC